MNQNPIESDGVRGRVLVVEDASVFREMQSLLLRQAGYEVVACEGPDSALLEKARQPFDLVLLNSDAPGIDAAEFLDHLRRPAPGPVVLFIAGVLTVELTRVLTRSGVDAVMQRPVDVKLLIGKIDELLGVTTPLPASRYLAAPPKVESISPFPTTAIGGNGGPMPGDSARVPSLFAHRLPSPPSPTAESGSTFRPNSSAPSRDGSGSPFRSDSTAPFRARSASAFAALIRD